MGMFNEVFKKCPRCSGGRAMAQISQVVLGFGGFNLDEPDRLAEELELKELRKLEEAVKDEWFECSCGHRFKLCTQAELDERHAIAARIADLRVDDES